MKVYLDKLGSTEIFRLKKFNALHYLYMGT